MSITCLKKGLLLALLTLVGPLTVHAEEQQKPQGPPPMLVDVAEVSRGTSRPMVELVGTVRYARVSEVAAEVGGIVAQVHFEEGARVKAGQLLVKLRSDLLETRLAGTRASYEQALVELEKAHKDLQRIEVLYREQSVAESLYDDVRYGALALEKRVASLRAELDHQQLELEKTAIPAPFGGLVQRKLVEKGEGVAAGGTVAMLADDRQLEAHIDVPQQLLNDLRPGEELNVRAAGRDYTATFIHFIPQGDVATRTFTVKLKLHDADGLIEGMEAHARLPNGPKQEGLLVPRDAVIKQFDQDVIFLVTEGRARKVPVTIKGYRGMQVAIEAPAVESGAKVVVKGNERIQDGQAIRTGDK